MYCIMQATVYRCLPDGDLKQLIVLQDADDSEEYYVCKWSIDIRTGAPLLLLAGKNAVLQVFDLVSGQLVTSCEGHGHSINDIAVHPTQPHLVVTASKDHCLRLWNLRSRTCVLVFEGDGGHRSEVLSADWRLGSTDDLTLVSGGMDNRVKIWDLAPFREVIQASGKWDPSSGVTFPAKKVKLPVLNVQGVHWNYVDCVRWLGPALVSKSVSDCIVCWMPDEEAEKVPRRREEGDPPPGQQEGPVRTIATLQLEGTRDVWWMRFALDFRGTVLAQGTSRGSVLLYSLHPLQEQPAVKLKPRRCRNDDSSKLLVRQTAVSFDGRILVTCHEDGSLTRYDRKDWGAILEIV